MVDPLLDAVRFAVVRARRQGIAMTTDIAPERMLDRPAGLLPPAWLLGHLNLYYPDILAILRDEPFTDDAKDDPLFAPGADPSDDLLRYPSKDALVEAFARGHDAVLDALVHARPNRLGRPTASRSLPTVGAFLVHLAVEHEAHHLGQLAAWRRAMGLPSGGG